MLYHPLPPKTRSPRQGSEGAQTPAARTKGASLLFTDAARTPECKRLESILLAHSAVADCAVLQRRTELTQPELVAYIVPSEPFFTEPLRAFIRSTSPEVTTPHAFVPVSSVPLTPDGQVDIEALSCLEVVDADLAGRWEKSLASLDGIEHSAVLIREHTRRSLPLHLSDLLPSAGAARTPERPVEPAPCEPKPAPTGLSRPAISEGEELRMNSGLPAVLSEVLHLAAKQGPHRGVVYLKPDGTERFQSYAALADEAARVLAGLRDIGLRPGDRVVLQLDGHQDFIEAYWGCVLGGFVPIPLAVPATYAKPTSSMHTLQSAWSLLGRPALLTTRSLAPDIAGVAERLGLDGLRAHALEDLRLEPDHRWHSGQPDDLALLMLTSGSTGVPKAVMLSHANLVSRTAGSRQLNGFGSGDVTLNWMPLDHVAGLIYFHIRDVFLGCQQIHVPTESILQDPLRWLDYLERFRATITFAPNFAYGLVSDREKEIGERSWDLSSVRFVLNGAEAIVTKTARRFLRLLGRQGLAPTSMHPAWGMSETSSGVTYSDAFSLEATSDDDPFVEVGRPIPGFALRIVDAQDQVVEEGHVGRLQVKGDPVTRGYFNDPDLNRESFTGDGWFKTGDLGVIRDGRLTITGREKDVVIINSVNYYSHAIEAAVEDVEGVETSYTAACAVRQPGSHTDRLAVFFHPGTFEQDPLTELLRRIRAEMRSKIGIGPDYLVPVATGAIPKTSLGKIQRSQLASRLVEGEFDEVLKRVDRLTGGANTLPDWFYRKGWRRKEGTTQDVPRGAALIFMDREREGVGARVRIALEAQGVPCVTVEPGASFERIGSGGYRIDPGEENHYRRLLGSLAEGGFEPRQVIHLWNYGKYEGEITDPEGIASAQVKGALSLLWLVQALARLRPDRSDVQLTLVASHVQRVLSDEPVAYEKSPVLGLIKSIPQELPWAQCRHVDIYEASADRAAECALREMRVLQQDREVAYRAGERWVARLEKVAFRAEAGCGLPFQRGGFYLIAGGLGGIGAHVSKYLLQDFEARVLLIGRSDLTRAEPRRREVFQALQQAGGEAAYESANVCDLGRLHDLILSYESRWDRRLNGVIHLAGLYRENLILEETRESFEAMLRPRMLGTCALHKLLESRGPGLFICSSSVAGFFGGANVAAYSAANGFLDAFAEHHRHHRSIEHYSFGWSTWEDVGQSRDYRMKDLLRSRGYQPMGAGQALNSLLIGLSFREPTLLVGLDGDNRHVRKHLSRDPAGLERVFVYTTESSASSVAEKLDEFEVRDRFGRRSRCEVVKLLQMPLTASGDVDKQQLALVGGRPGRSGAQGARPQTDTEKGLADIWKRLLGVSDVGLDDSFFELGGDSLLAMRLLSRIRDAFQVDLSVRAIFEAATLADLTLEILKGRRSGVTKPAVLCAPLEADPESLLARLDEMGDQEVQTLLTQMTAEDEAKE